MSKVSSNIINNSSYTKLFPSEINKIPINYSFDSKYMYLVNFKNNVYDFNLFLNNHHAILQYKEKKKEKKNKLLNAPGHTLIMHVGTFTLTSQKRK